ncbi:MAG: hypothetical protein EBR82_45555 [Caulobacteraceae bacterium]|nr:hypothetical protein [Caulobacteraceae bacterium]
MPLLDLRHYLALYRLADRKLKLHPHNLLQLHLIVYQFLALVLQKLLMIQKIDLIQFQYDLKLYQIQYNLEYFVELNSCRHRQHRKQEPLKPHVLLFSQALLLLFEAAYQAHLLFLLLLEEYYLQVFPQIYHPHYDTFLFYLHSRRTDRFVF